jgi:pSer/pThr/pTyr-binding forkhead associated (FHA) protein
MPEIVVKFDNRVVERIVTEKEYLSIGRTSDNDIVLDNRGVSRKHARIDFTGYEAVLIDNESLNGTFVNSKKVTEEKLRDKDVITIGKFDLEYHSGPGGSEKMSDHDGTMILDTKRQRDMVKMDKHDQQIIQKAGCSVLMGLENARVEEVQLDRDVITLGKSKYVNVKVGGFFTSGIQAKVMQEGPEFFVLNVGRPGKTKLNGEAIQRQELRNGDILQVGNSTFRFIEAH